MTSGSRHQPLDGVTVVDFTQLVAGPYCTMLLADLGADVIKVEPPNGDSMRQLGARAEGADYGGAFATLNRNKRSIAVDLKKADDREIVVRLLEQADVVVENWRPGTATKLGIGFDDVVGLNSDIVYVSISGFGQSGPLSGLGGYDIVAQAMSGLMSVTGTPEGEPVKVGVPITDVASGMLAATGVLAALRQRDATGEAQLVDCSLLEAGVAFSVWESAEYWVDGTAPGPLGSAHRGLAPYQAVHADGGWFVLAANSDDLFRRASSALGHPEWADDPRFADNSARLRHRPTLIATIEAVTRTEPAAHWVARLQEVGVPSGEVLDYPAVLNHPHLEARGMVIDAAGAPHRVLGSPIHLNKVDVSYRPAPARDADRNDILRELGVSRRGTQAR